MCVLAGEDRGGSVVVVVVVVRRLCDLPSRPPFTCPLHDSPSRPPFTTSLHDLPSRPPFATSLHDSHMLLLGKTAGHPPSRMNHSLSSQSQSNQGMWSNGKIQPQSLGNTPVPERSLGLPRNHAVCLRDLPPCS